MCPEYLQACDLNLCPGFLICEMLTDHPSWCHSLWSMYLWGDDFNFLCLSFLTCEMGRNTLWGIGSTGYLGLTLWKLAMILGEKRLFLSVAQLFFLGTSLVIWWPRVARHIRKGTGCWLKAASSLEVCAWIVCFEDDFYRRTVLAASWPLATQYTFGFFLKLFLWNVVWV